MFNAKRIPAAVLICAVSLGGSGFAYAETGTMDDDNFIELRAVLNAPKNILRAIDVAEQQAGGKAFEVYAFRENGSIVYEVVSVKNRNVSFTTIDPVNGIVLKTENEDQYEQPFDDQYSGALDKFAASSTTLTQIIAAAEKYLGGVAVGAEFDENDENNLARGDTQFVKVKVFKEEALKTVLVDIESNTVVMVRGEEE